MALRGPLAGTARPSSNLRGPLAGASTDGGSRYAEIAKQQVQDQITQENQISASQARYANSAKGLAVNTVKDMGSKFADPFIQLPSKLIQNTSDAVSDVAKGLSPSSGMPILDRELQVKKGIEKGLLRNAGDIAGAAFSPISTAIGSVLQATGGQRILDSTGTVVANSSGITDWPAFQRFAMQHPNAGEDFQRSLNLLLAGEEAGADTNAGKSALNFANKLVGGNDKTLTGARALYEVRFPEVKDESVQGEVNINRLEKKLPVQEEPSAFSDNNVQFNNDYRQEVPDIQMGSTPRSSLPDIRYPEPNANRVGPYTYESIKEAAPAAPVLKGPLAPVAEQAPAPVAAAPVAESIDVPAPAKVETPSAAKPIDIPQGKAESTRGTTLLKAAVEKDLMDGYRDLPTHDRVDMRQQADDATDFALSNRALAESIAMGEHTGQLPSNIMPESIYHAMERIAIRDGDVALIDRLSRSDVPTRAGQGLKALDSSDPLSPVAILRSIRKVLEKASGKKGDVAARTKQIIKEEEAKLEKELSDSLPRRPDWETFVKSITCGY